jgi:hypothetical protein
MRRDFDPSEIRDSYSRFGIFEKPDRYEWPPGPESVEPATEFALFRKRINPKD